MRLTGKGVCFLQFILLLTLLGRCGKPSVDSARLKRDADVAGRLPVSPVG
jgi:hypothetical protein